MTFTLRMAQGVESLTLPRDTEDRQALLARWGRRYHSHSTDEDISTQRLHHQEAKSHGVSPPTSAHTPSLTDQTSPSIGV